MLLTYFVRYAFPNNTAMVWRIVSGLIPALNLFHVNWGLWQIQAFQSLGFGVANDVHRNYTISLFFLMAIVDLVVWVAVSLYISYIIPTEFGTRKHPCFCFMKKKKQRPEQRKLLSLNDSEELEGSPKAKNFEKVGNDLKELEEKDECLRIHKLKKIYPNGFHAVNNLSLTMYSGQIFALLGHNGAGKTTTISMLTGLFGSSGGYAEAFGIDLLNDQDEARKIMGV